MHDSACPFCQAPHQTEFHMYWNCPVHRTSEDPAIVGTQNLLAQARDGYTSGQHAYWIRTLIPGDWTTPSRAPSQHTAQLGEGPTIGLTHPTIYTDGSGGDATHDPRCRRCGWSWIIMDSEKRAVLFGERAPLYRGPRGPNSSQCRTSGPASMFVGNSAFTQCCTCRYPH